MRSLSRSARPSSCCGWLLGLLLVLACISHPVEAVKRQSRVRGSFSYENEDEIIPWKRRKLQNEKDDAKNDEKDDAKNNKNGTPIPTVAPSISPSGEWQL